VVGRTLAFLIVLGAVAPARADAVDDLVARGEELARTGEFSQAIAAFKAADAQRPRAKHACLIGLAYTRRELWPQAELFLALCRARATADDPLPDWIAAAEAQLATKLAAIDTALVTIIVTPPAAAAAAKVTVSSFEPDERFAPRTIHLTHGTHVIEVTAPGYVTASRELEITSHAPQTVELHLVTPAEQLASQAAAEQKIVEKHASPPLPRLPLVVLGAGGALAVGAAAYQWFAYRPARNKLANAPNTFAYDEAKHVFEVRRAIDIALYSAAAVTVTVGAVLLYKLRRHAPVSASIGPTSVMLSLELP
jgi:hypothetical protein